MRLYKTKPTEAKTTTPAPIKATDVGLAKEKPAGAAAEVSAPVWTDVIVTVVTSPPPTVLVTVVVVMSAGSVVVTVEVTVTVWVTPGSVTVVVTVVVSVTVVVTVSVTIVEPWLTTANVSQGLVAPLFLASPE